MMSGDEHSHTTVPDTEDYDSPWKKALETYFKEFIAFFFPNVASDVDWGMPHVFLDQELQQVTRGAAIGRRAVDKLVQLHRKNGSQAWVLVHIEVQAQYDTDFPKRMYVYNYRIYDQFDRQVASLAILADDRPAWRPDHFSYDLWGSKAGLWFPVLKLLDYAERWEVLEQSENPFASVVMAHLKAMETARNTEGRYQWKLYLIKRLYRLNYGKEDVIRLFEFIDWIMVLPKALEKALWTEIQSVEEKKKMAYVSSVEKIGIEKGMQQGMQQGMLQGELRLLARQIARRFGTNFDAVASIFSGMTTEQLEELGERFIDAQSLDEMRDWAVELRQREQQERD